MSSPSVSQPRGTFKREAKRSNSLEGTLPPLSHLDRVERSIRIEAARSSWVSAGAWYFRARRIFAPTCMFTLSNKNARICSQSCRLLA